MPVLRRLSPVLLALVALLASGSVAQAGPNGPAVAAIAPSTALTGSTRFSFDEDVLGVSTGNVLLRAGDAETTVPADLVCMDAAGAGTPCDTGVIRTVRLVPRAPLLPGASYEAVVNPPGSAAVVDRGDLLAVATTSARFVASVVEQENSAGARYGWRTARGRAARGGSFRVERQPGATAAFEFEGSSVTWYTRLARSEGRATVLIDGRRVARVNNHARTVRFVGRRFTARGAGRHRLVVRVSGRPGARGGGRWVTVDGFRAGSSAVRDGSYRWRSMPSAARAGYAVSDARGARVAFRFYGTGIDWYTVMGPRMGRAAVYVDGRRRAVVDSYANTARYGVRRSFTGLRSGVHELVIRVLGTRQRRARGALVAIDAWSLKAPTDSFRGLGAWIDIFDHGTSAFRAGAVADMATRGVRTLYLETARYDSVSAFGDRGADRTAEVSDWIERAHAAGMRVIGWYFPSYCSSLATDVARTAAVAGFRTLGGQTFDGLGIDIEYKGACPSPSAFGAGAAEHLRQVRARVSAVYPVAAITPAPLGMAIRPEQWVGFPWKEIGAYADAVLPMAYWSYRTDCATNVQHCPSGYATGNVSQAHSLTGLPVHAIGGIANAVTPAAVGEFAAAAGAAGAFGCSLYDFRTTSTALWAPLSACAAGRG